MYSTVNRFDETVENYLKYRPSYPKDIYNIFSEQFNLTSEKIIADVGSGTGFLSQLFLEKGHKVYGVEPNQKMRAAAENYLAPYNSFYSVNGLAEATTLDKNSVDCVIVGTAFHWFDVEKTKMEFKRILKLPGYCLLVWNVRDKSSELIQDYEELISSYNEDYRQFRKNEFDPTIVEKFFSPNKMLIVSISNKQYFSWEGFKGRLLSTSYSLRENHFQYQEMINKLKNIFDKHKKSGLVEFLYETKIYYGQLQ